MKKLSLLAQGLLYTCVLFAQPSFQTTLEAGVSMPLNSNNLNETHTGKAIHFGNHLDYTFGNASVRVGLGAYIGYINAISTDNKYKEIGQAIASKYRFDASQLIFNSSSFKSTDILLGPVASFGSSKCNINVWAKGGYGLNEPGRYSVVDKENGTTNNIYINQAGENKNGLAYSLGAGIQYAISDYVGLKLSASYFSTQTDQVNYNFDREKGTVPLYATASNQFIQASAGVQFSIGNPDKRKKAVTDFGTAAGDTDNPPAAVIKIKTKSNIKNDRLINPDENTPGQGVIKIKTKSNIKNDRLTNNSDDHANDNPDNDSLFFSPQKIELRTALPSQEAVSLQSVDNYLTGFLYRRRNGAVIAQCVSSAADSDPIPGVDVHLKRLGTAGNYLMTAKTNKDGSFSFNNIAAGNYIAEAADATMSIAVNGNNESGFKILDINGGSCGDAKENYIINAGDKTYVEITSAQQNSSDMANGKKHIANVKYADISKTVPHDAPTGMTPGSRIRKPYLTSNMQFETNMNNIVSCDGKLYAEVITAREAGTGMASGRRTLVTGDIDGDGLTDNTIVSPRDPASGLPTGKRMHKPYVITKELDITEDQDDIVSPRDAASGLATGKRMHKPYVITKELDITEDQDDIVSPRDAASGLATGKRMHKPYVITKELDAKRMHKPFVITVEVDAASNEIISPRDAASGLPTGKRMHKPYSITIDPDEDTYEVISPSDAASGLPTGKRMHKPFVITKELGYNEEGNEIAIYKIIHRDIAARNVLLTDNNDDETEKMAITEQGLPKKKPVKKGIITGKDNDTGLYSDNSTAGEVVVKSPLYEPGGSQGTNPLFEGRDALHVTGESGKGHDIFIPSNIVIVLPANQSPAEYTSYDVGPVKWMAPESMSSGKGIQEKGMKMTPEKMEANSERKGWDGTVKGGSIVQSISRVHCADGSCSIDAIVLVDGTPYEALITGVLKTKHDTVKNSISNIR